MVDRIVLGQKDAGVAPPILLQEVARDHGASGRLRRAGCQAQDRSQAVMKLIPADRLDQISGKAVFLEPRDVSAQAGAGQEHEGSAPQGGILPDCSAYVLITRSRHSLAEENERIGIALMMCVDETSDDSAPDFLKVDPAAPFPEVGLKKGASGRMMLDIARDARWGRMVEGAGEDPYLGAAIARAPG